MSDPQTTALLREFVYARNSLRSAEAAAKGFVSGKRIYALRAAKQREQETLAAIADWAEQRAREEIGLGAILSRS